MLEEIQRLIDAACGDRIEAAECTRLAYDIRNLIEEGFVIVPLSHSLAGHLLVDLADTQVQTRN